jgi:hypothetical protein
VDEKDSRQSAPIQAAESNNVDADKTGPDSENQVDDTKDSPDIKMNQDGVTSSEDKPIEINADDPLIEVIDSTGRKFTCNAFVTNAEDVHYELRVKSILLTNVLVCHTLKPLQLGRGLIIIPPNTKQLNNFHPIFVIFTDNSSFTCPEDFVLVHISMILEPTGKHD